MLRTEADDVGTSLAGVQKEGERETRLAADRVVRLEARDLIWGPRVIAALAPFK